MKGGTISNNKGWTGGSIYSYCGHANLSGSSICKNTAMNGTGAVNGGGWMILNGAQMHENIADKDNYSYGGGIQNSGILTLSSGAIYHNKDFTADGGIWSKADKVEGHKTLAYDNT